MISKSFDNIKIPSNLDNIIDKAVDKVYKEKIKKNRIKNKIAIAVALFLIILSVGITKPAIANNIPLLKSVFEEIQESIFFRGPYSEYATSINEKVVDNGVSITLSEVLCDGEYIYVSYLIETDKAFNYNKIEDNEGVENFQNNILEYNGYGKTSFSMKKINNGFLEGRFLNDHTFVGIEKYDLTTLNKDIPDKFSLNIRIDKISASNGRESDIREGKWNFSINVIADRSLTKTIEVNDINKDGIGIAKITVNPFEIKILTNHNKNLSKVGIPYRINVQNEKGVSLNSRLVSYSKSDATGIFQKDEFSENKIRVILYTEVLGDKDSSGGRKILGKDIIFEKEYDLKINN